MPLTAAELTTELQETNRRLTDAIDGLRTEVAELRKDVARINTSLNWARAIGGIIAASAVSLLILAFGVAHRATQIEDAVATLQKDTAELKADFRARDDRLSQALGRI